MAKTLITFLARAQYGKNTFAGGYRNRRYIFPDDLKEQHTASLEDPTTSEEESTISEEKPTTLFAHQLISRIDVDSIIILGTSGSAWNSFFQEDAIEAKEKELQLEIAKKAQDEKMTQADLDHLNPYASAYFDHKDVDLRIIPNGFTDEEQHELLDIIKEATQGKNEITLDVTHAFRHLPMLSMVAVVYLKYVQEIKINTIWCGILDSAKDKAYAHDLKELLVLFDWIDALSKYDYSADYGVFAELLAQENKEYLVSMQQAAFYENINAVNAAREHLESLSNAFQNHPFTGIAALIQPALEKRMAWAKQEDQIHDRQAHLSKMHLDGGDYMRAIIFAFEACISKLTFFNKGNPEKSEHREEIRKRHQNNDPMFDDFEIIRNTTAHGTKLEKRYIKRYIKDERQHLEIQEVLNDEEKLKEKISSFLIRVQNLSSNEKITPLEIASDKRAKQSLKISGKNESETISSTTNTLITFLGRQKKGYYEISYIFPDGFQGERTALFSRQLVSKSNFNKIILLGTAGSMWDCFFPKEEDHINSEEKNKIRDIRDKAKNEKMTQEDLAHLHAYASAYFDHQNICLRIVPNGFTGEEQYELLRIIQEETQGENEIISMDITHSFRHIPMLSIVIAVYLKYVQTIKIHEIWYGVLHHQEDEAGKAYNLKGLLELFDWIEALSKYDYSADYGVFTKLLAQKKQNRPISKVLQKAAFLENTNVVHKARRKVEIFNKKLQEKPFTGITAFIHPELEKRMAWANKEELFHVHDRQAHLAEIHRDAGNYMQAVINTYESYISKLVYFEEGDPGEYKDRKRVRKIYDHDPLFYTFELIRNTIIHVSEPPKYDPAKNILYNEKQLKEKITSFLRYIKNLKPLSKKDEYKDKNAPAQHPATKPL